MLIIDAGQYPGAVRHTEYCWAVLQTGRYRAGQSPNPQIRTIDGIEQIRVYRVETPCAGEEIASQAVAALKKYLHCSNMPLELDQA